MSKKLKSKVGVDVPPVTEDEALELMVHHLSLAAAYYEATGSNEDENFQEIIRLLRPLPQMPEYEGAALTAAKSWFQAMRKYYDALEVEYSDEKETKPN